MKEISKKQAENLRKMGKGHRIVRTRNHWYLIEDLGHRDSSGQPKPRFIDNDED